MKSVPFVLLALIVSSACNRVSPTQPSPSLGYAGRWLGLHQILTCEGGVDFRLCSRFLTQTGALELELSLAGSNEISGTMTVEAPSPASNNIAFVRPVRIPVTGRVTTSGELRLSGVTTVDDASYTLDQWSGVLERDTGTVAGRMVVVASGYTQGFRFAQTLKVTSELRGLHRE